MSFEFLKSIRFNFINFFAYSFFLAYVFLSAIIIILDTHANNPHVSEIRNQIGNICLLIVGFYFGASKGSKMKDESLSEAIKQNTQKDLTLQTVVESGATKDEALKHANEVNKKLTDEIAVNLARE